MKTEEKLAQTLKELMSKEPLDKITVKRLSSLCGINRQTFYYHFRDIYDLLTWIFLNESIRNAENITNSTEAIAALFSYIEENRAFVENVLSSAGRELLIEFFYNSIYSVQMRALKLKDKDNILSSEDKKFIARFYSPAIIYVFVFWIDNGMKESKEELTQRLSIVCAEYLSEAVARFKEAKKR